LSITRDNPNVDIKAPAYLGSKIDDVGDHCKLNAMFQSPFVGGSLLIYPLLILVSLSKKKLCHYINMFAAI
jgi:hypothetical protein